MYILYCPHPTYETPGEHAQGEDEKDDARIDVTQVLSYRKETVHCKFLPGQYQI
jgi:hypothetical protein